MTTITSITTLPGSPYNGTGIVGIVITSGVPTYLRIVGVDLDRIVDVTWFPANPASVLFEKRNMILKDSTIGTCMITVTNNYLYDYDRAGHISFRLDDGTTLTAPVKTFGRVSVAPLWSAPGEGLITG